MCLIVCESHVNNPIAVKKCIKVLRWISKFSRWAHNDTVGFYTPYMNNLVPVNNGWFTVKYPSRRKLEYVKYDDIEDGYLHGYQYMPNGGTGHKKLPRDKVNERRYFFQAYAFDVVAVGDNDLVCKKLYIPAFDLTPEVSKIYLESIGIVLPS